MCREIKFRVWEKGTKTLLGYEYFNTILNNGFMYTNLSELKEGEDEGDLVCHSEFHAPPMLRPKGFNPLFREQYSGLKDKNGKEIYESDIVKTDFKQDGSHETIQVIEFYEGAFGSRNKDDHFRIPALFSGRATEGMNTNYYEVIGNIHENPELL